jgi:SAM-dependent methyltransferase
VADDIGASVVEADLAAPVPLPDGCADAVTAVHVLHELPFPLPLLREARRIAKSGATLLLFDWVRQPLDQYVADQPLDADLLQHFREHCAFTPDDLAYLCRATGWKVLEVIGRRNNGYAMVACVKT